MSKTIVDLHTELVSAEAAYVEAYRLYEAARSEEINTRNKLNAAQHAFVAQLKKEAPRESDWKRCPEEHSGRPVRSP